jgi:hypothetical protein
MRRGQREDPVEYAQYTTAMSRVGDARAEAARDRLAAQAVAAAARPGAMARLRALLGRR